MSSIEFIPAVLGERARQQSEARAYTVIDYEVDPASYFQRLTWSQAHRCAQVVAAELASCGSPGDRVAICALQGTVLNDVVSCARALPGPLPAVIEIDALDLDCQQTFSTNVSGSRITRGGRRTVRHQALGFVLGRRRCVRREILRDLADHGNME